ncbi:Uncharacterized protein Rs2_44264 [Raphanus sativus]|nr:Uncharacterized protein Rs2_44264 [Raphanus sativus]
MGHPRPLSRPVGPIPSDGRSLIFQGSKSLFTDPAITTRPSPVLWPHLHGIANHFPIGHPSFHYSSPSTLNSGVLNGCVTEKLSVAHGYHFLTSLREIKEILRLVKKYRQSSGLWRTYGLTVDQQFATVCLMVSPPSYIKLVIARVEPQVVVASNVNPKLAEEDVSS